MTRAQSTLVLFIFALSSWADTGWAQQSIHVAFPDKEAERKQPEFLKYDPYRKELLKHGIDATLYQLPLDAKRLRQYHVVIYGGWNEDSTIRTLDAETRKRAAAERAVLEEYVREGGGLIILPSVRRYPGQAIEEYYSLVLQGFGARVLLEGVWDPAHNFQADETLAFPSMPYFLGANIKEHPVTAGVKRIWLPQSKYQNGNPGVAAVVYDGNWTTLVSADASAKSYKVTPGMLLDVAQPGSYKAAPPLVAARSFGKGRIVCYPLPSIYISLNWDHPSWPHTVEFRGNVAAKEPSDSHRLVVNALRWVAEPSQQLAGFGPREKPAPAPIHFPDRVSLPKSALDAYRPKEPFEGIVGAHSAFSDGRGTLQEYVQAGARAGLNFIIFTEALEHLTKEKWQELVKECQEQNRKGGIFLVPGYEYSDVNGCRWAIWGHQVPYPNAAMWAQAGKRIFADGNLALASNNAARMLLTYDTLPGDPANMWWYYQVPIWNYDGGRLQADNLNQYLLAEQNLFAVSTGCFTRIRSPQEVAAAARNCTLNVERNRYASPLPAVDTSLSQWNSWTYVSQGGKEGPKIEWIACDRAGSDIYRTRGTQRWRGAFVARSATGLKEIRIHDGTLGIVRRYLCHGAKEFRRTLELALDRQHYLVMEAVDSQNRRAVYSGQRLFFYERGFYRCSDNNNLLGSTPTGAHPDRHEFPRFPIMEDWDLLSLNGFDTGVGVLNQPSANLTAWAIRTKAGQQGVHSLPAAKEDTGMRQVQTPLRFPFASYEISIVQAQSDRYVRRLAQSPATGPFLPQDKELEFATINRRVYLLRSRMDYPLKWNYRRPHEAAEPYQGDVFVHEGAITFKSDVTLDGELPIELERVEYRGGTAYGQADTILVADAQKGALERRFGPNDRLAFSGDLAKGGYIAGQFTTGGSVVVVPAMEGMRYQINTVSTGLKSLRWTYSVGLGRAGQSFKKDQTLPYLYLAVSLSGRTPKDDRLIKGLGQAFGLAGAPGEHSIRAEVGREKGSDVFITGEVKDHEIRWRLNRWPLLLNRPLRIQGVRPNGCAAVYIVDGTAEERKFRFVGVFEGAALFQHNTDKEATVWAGNPFYTDDEQLKLTLVLDGLSAGEKPFIEIHNPTDRKVNTVLRSPPHTPLYGGRSGRVQVPAGDSIFVSLPTPNAAGQRR
jgi:hypothetical protein